MSLNFIVLISDAFSMTFYHYAFINIACNQTESKSSIQKKRRIRGMRRSELVTKLHFFVLLNLLFADVIIRFCNIADERFFSCCFIRWCAPFSERLSIELLVVSYNMRV